MRWTLTSTTMVRIHATHDLNKCTRVIYAYGLCAGSASEIEVDGFGDDFKAASGSGRKVYEVDHTSLTQQQVERIMATEVEHISNIFGVEVRPSPRVHPAYSD